MLRRQLMIVLSLIMVIGLVLSACSSNPSNDKTSKNSSQKDNNDNKQGEGTSATEEYKLPFANDDVTLTFAGVDSWSPNITHNDNLPIFQEMEKRTGVKINWQMHPFSQYNTSIQTRLAAGKDLPDIFAIPPFGAGADVVRYGSEGILLPLDEYINEQNAPNIVKLFEEHPDLKKILTSPDGHIYAVGELMKKVNTLNPRVYMLRKDWLDNLGLSEPETADDWYNMLKAFKEQDPNGNGQADEIPMIVSHGFADYSLLGSAFGIYPGSNIWINENGKLYYQYDQPAFKEFLTFLNKLYNEGLLDPEFASNDEKKTISMVAKGNVGTTPHQLPVVDRYNKDIANSGIEGEYIPVLPPVNMEGERYIIKRSPMGGRYGVLKDTKHPEIAVKWIDYLWASEEGLLLQNFGIEGQSYTMKDGKPVFTEYITNNPDGLSPIDSLRKLGAFPSFLSHQLYDFKTQTTPEKVVQFADGAQEYMIEPFPSMLGTSEEVEELSSLIVDITTYEDEMIQKFVMGNKPISEFDNFVSTLKRMGIERVVEIKQTQYDRSNQ
ncbi:extracellular solute-binding protein [Paenibacillus sp. J5C_2022]|uniref:extracellular solute-binding protein n=1 Tax=Paenibacillus sp. J5C2022 TaxID=2977129 RepID=UPI0021CF1AA4|nr:extracellular solute-binding protein [Paenibacillus sp. J5C2022]MCU6710195.1 extracellular solute-binding protein [Paenibacillus sp. J5C2022]